MAIVGKALRQAARSEAQEDLHPEWGAQRALRQTLYAQAVHDREAKYPILTAENALEAVQWQETRSQELCLKAGLPV